MSTKSTESTNSFLCVFVANKLLAGEHLCLSAHPQVCGFVELPLLIGSYGGTLLAKRVLSTSLFAHQESEL